MTALFLYSACSVLRLYLCRKTHLQTGCPLSLYLFSVACTLLKSYLDDSAYYCILYVSLQMLIACLMIQVYATQHTAECSMTPFMHGVFVALVCLNSKGEKENRKLLLFIFVSGSFVYSCSLRVYENVKESDWFHLLHQACMLEYHDTTAF